MRLWVELSNGAEWVADGADGKLTLRQTWPAAPRASQPEYDCESILMDKGKVPVVVLTNGKTVKWEKTGPGPWGGIVKTPLTVVSIRIATGNGGEDPADLVDMVRDWKRHVDDSNAT